MCANFFGLNAVNNSGVKGIYSTQRINQNPYFSFGQAGLDRDKFEYNSNSINRYTTEASLKNAVQQNPNIRQILSENGMPVELHMENLRNVLANHSTDTQNIAMGIYDHLSASIKSEVNKQSLKDACYLHDVGKVLIPDEILKKPDKLTPEEQKIMHTHSLLSYELLKNSDINPQTLNLIKYHHQNSAKNGYPVAEKDFNDDANLEVLSLADKYSALTEKRSYKEPLSPEKALAILYKDVKNGKTNPNIFQALVAYTRDVNTQNDLMKSAA